MTEKVYTWDKRHPMKFPLGKNCGPHQVYFFRRSFEDCTGKTMKSLTHSMIETSERTYGVVYTPDAQTLINKNSVETVQDPLLKAIFGLRCHPDQRSILDYYERLASQNDKEFMPFVDLCVVLGEQNRAQKFADRVGKEFEILKILDKSEGQIQSEVLRMDAIQMWLEKAPKNLAAARLTSIIHRCAENANGESELRSLAELWGEGFYWDALCLVSILMPNQSVLMFMKENIPKFLRHYDGGLLAGVLNSVTTAEMKQEGPIATAFDNAYLKHLDALSVYRIVKIDICRNERNTSSDIEKLGVRAKCYEALRFVLLTSLAQQGPLEAKIMAADAVAYIKTFGIAVFSDYFPNAERVLFETFVGMIADVYSVVIRVVQPNTASSSTLSFENDNCDDFMSVIFGKWRKEYGEVWAATGYWARSSFMQTCHSLLNYLAVLEKILNATNDLKGKMLKLALRLCCLFASDEFNSSKGGSHPIVGIIDECGFSRDHAQTIVNAFALKEGSEISASGPIHLTGDEFISTIKQQGVVLSPLKSETKLVAPQMPTPPDVEQEVHPAEEPLKTSDVHLARGETVKTMHHEDVPVEMEQKMVEQSAVQPAISDESNSLKVAAHRDGPVFTTTTLTGEVGNVVPIVSREPAATVASVAISPGSTIMEANGDVNAVPEAENPDERCVKAAEPAPKMQSIPAPNVAAQQVTLATAPVENTCVVVPASAAISAAHKVSICSQYSDDGWGDSPSKGLPSAAPSPSFANRSQFEQQTQQIQQQQQVFPAPLPQPSFTAAAPNALDNLLNTCSVNGGGDAQSVASAGLPTQSNVTSRASSVSAAAACDDSRSSHSIASSAATMTASSAPVQVLNTSSATSTASSAPKQKFAIGGFEQASGETGFGNFGACSFGSTGGGGRGGGRGGYGGGFQGGNSFGQTGGQGGTFGGGNRGGYGHGGGSGYRGGGGNFRGGDGGRGRGGYAPRGSYNNNH